MSATDIRTLDTVAGIHEAARVLDEVWGEQGTMPANILRALEHAGNYVVGLFDGDRMIGASAAFFGPPAERTMHSHITGIVPGQQGRGLGRQLKEHQRAWALERGVGRITWTFDPLVARNAHFNLAVLGARATEYLVDHYGAMADAVNRGDESDRLMVSWALAEPPAPTPTDAEIQAVVAVPDAIEHLRRSDPVAAAGWRRRVRDDLREHLASGRRIGGFDRRGYLIVG
ncbi:putative GNAT superfamily acetyltransferase [Microbacterium testaceum]|uniref:GNAT family N-acetyltransferase n=1 Tax=Microbacterium TaxID=33882 RepID=UPI00278A1EB6|nr:MULTISPECIES: GNAT family N-acetyltransferase [Microbacterium]MDQ1112066.1 putative GNAT superfamily acetyltransferase [Microbacterium testaceum]MDR6097400.1 putative GNAT superfamily acetyltransferase [Microbacterium sp. SORGH_AS_0454]